MREHTKHVAIVLEVCYILLYVVSVIFFWAGCFSRIIFTHAWTFQYDICLFGFGLALLGIHYSIMFWCIKRRYLHNAVLWILCAVDGLLFSVQLGVIICWGLLSLLFGSLIGKIENGVIVPTVIADVCFLALRCVSMCYIQNRKKHKKTGDDSPS